MKKTIITLACGAVILCGCTKHTNTSYADRPGSDLLSQKLDVVLINQGITISNQMVIWKEVEALKTKLDTSSQMSLYYYTNQLNDQVFCASNVIGALASDEQKSVDAINAETFRIAQMNTIMILTNDNVIDMESEIEKIRIKLGIH